MRHLIAPLAIAGVLVLGGCASGQPAYSEDAAAELQQQVLTVSEASAAGEFETAVMRLDELVVLANDSLARHLITPERHQSILSAIDLVRADLAAEIAARQPPPPPEPAPAPAPENNGNDENNGNNGNDENNGNNGNDEKGNNKNKDKDEDEDDDD
ncbi:hypothetical protein [Diaminobutyricimonas sp. TR449]|uniref:hypothetical protein n=1 Tax=Diaminobutyricimonas sp. TR449 TaxID=2708076 RepID=UPI001AB03BBD|nr:hypothetical protein [Diaminobutyricimonas sp. TR449]